MQYYFFNFHSNDKMLVNVFSKLTFCFMYRINVRILLSRYISQLLKIIFNIIDIDIKIQVTILTIKRNPSFFVFMKIIFLNMIAMMERRVESYILYCYKDLKAMINHRI